MSAHHLSIELAAVTHRVTFRIKTCIFFFLRTILLSVNILGHVGIGQSPYTCNCHTFSGKLQRDVPQSNVEPRPDRARHKETGF